MPHENKMLLKSNLAFEAAKEPTDIIWEHLESDDKSWFINRNTNKCCKTQFCCKTIVAILIAVFVCLMFMFFWWMKRESSLIQRQFPP